jgi:glycosyltransferase involved in cell wall biosynthesis
MRSTPEPEPLVFQFDEVGLAQAVERTLSRFPAEPGQTKSPALWRRAWRWALRHSMGATHWNRWQQYNSRRQGLAWLRRAMADSAKPVLVYVVPFDIWKLRSGGGQRIAGIAKAFTRDFNVFIFTNSGSVREFAFRKLAETCHLVAVPLGPEFIQRTQVMAAGTGLFAFIDYVEWLPDVQRVLEVAAAHASAWGFTHPTAWPVVRRYIRPECAVFYDAHDDYAQFLQDAYGSDNPELSQRLVALEYDVLKHVTTAAYCTEADLTAAKIRLEREAVSAPHSQPPRQTPPGGSAPMLVVPNGVDVAACRLVIPSQARQNRESAGIDRPIILFVGAHHKPNYEAVEFILQELAPAFPHAIFAVMGMNLTAVRERGGAQPGNNVVFTGPLPEALKETIMALAEVALAPMVSGTGSSLKIPDYVAHGQVVIGTAIGMRGFTELAHYSSVMVTDDVRAALANSLRMLETNPQSFDKDCQAAREWVEKTLDWTAAAQPLLEAVRHKSAETIALPSH